MNTGKCLMIKVVKQIELITKIETLYKKYAAEQVFKADQMVRNK